MTKRYLSALILVTVSLLLATSANADSAWSPLGQRVVTDRAEFDAFQLGPERGRFTGLKLEVDDAPVLIRRVVVHYGNGERSVRDRNVRIGEDQRTGTFDLPGGKRVISKVVFYYEASSPGFERATVKLWGRR